MTIVVKVGAKASKVRFNTYTNVKRAVTVSELINLTANNDCHVVIVEGVRENEEEQIKEFINNFSSNTSNTVLFYPNEDDSNTMGLVDELGYSIQTSLDMICETIEEKYNAKVKIEYGLKVDQYDDEIGDNEIFGTPDEETAKILDTIDENDKAPQGLFGEYSDAVFSGVSESTDTEIPVIKVDEPIDENEENSDSVNTDIEEDDNADIEQVYKLKMELSDLRARYNTVVDDMSDANGRLMQLEGIIDTLKSEKESLKAEFDKLVGSDDIYEDPISLVEYEGNLRKLEADEARIVELEESLSVCKGKLGDAENDISSKTKTIESLETKASELEQELNSIKASLNGEESADSSNDFVNKVEQLKSERESFSAEIESLTAKLEDNNATIALLNKNLKLETEYRYESMSVFMDLLTKLKVNAESMGNVEGEQSKLIEKIASLESKLSETQHSLDEKINELDSANTRIGELESLEIVNKELNETKEKQREKIKELEDKNTEQQDKLDDLSADLESLNDLVEIKQSEFDKTLAETIADKDKLFNDMVAEKDKLLQDTIAEKDKAYTELNNTHEKLKADTDNTIATKDETIENNEATIKSLNETIKNKEYTILEKDRQISEKDSSLAELQEKLDTVDTEIQGLKDTIEAHEKTIKDKEYENELQVTTIEQRDSDIDSLKEEIDVLKGNEDRLNNKLARTEERVKSTLERLKLTGGDIEKVLASIEKEGVLDEEEANELRAQLADLEETVKARDSEIETLEKLKNDLAEKLEDKDKQLAEAAELLEEINNSEADGTAVSEEEFNEVKQKNMTLLEKNKALVSEVGDLSREKNSLQITISRLQAQVDNLSSLQNTPSVGGAVRVRKINYTGEAQIISVFGHGSYGITTTAMSIANRLAATTKVLYIDLDMTAPKADIWFRKSPIIEVGGVRNTSLGCFVGANTLTHDMVMKYCIDVASSKGGSISYFSGFLAKPDEARIAGADFSSLLNTLGSIFAYIVIDLGKVGSSEFNDSLIKAITDISYSNVVVSLDDRHSVRGLSQRLQGASIDNSQLSWMFNMVRQPNNVGNNALAALDAQVKQMVGNSSSVGVMYEDAFLRENRTDLFFKSHTNKNNFEYFLNNAVFGKR